MSTTLAFPDVMEGVIVIYVHLSAKIITEIVQLVRRDINIYFFFYVHKYENENRAIRNLGNFPDLLEIRAPLGFYFFQLFPPSINIYNRARFLFAPRGRRRLRPRQRFFRRRRSHRGLINSTKYVYYSLIYAVLFFVYIRTRK